MIVNALAVGLWLLVIIGAWRSRSRFQHTTLVAVLPWSFAAMACWLVVAVSGLEPAMATSAWRSYAGYLAAVISLTPGVAVLGSRRPTCRAWPVFVIIPLILVLMWPTITIGLTAGWSRPLQLERPQFWIYGLVAVMSLGNYVGTRFTLPVLLATGSLCYSLLAFSPDQSAQSPQQLAVISSAGLMLAVCSLAGLWLLRQPVVAASRFDRVWNEFVMLYGIVWSRRLLDRLQVLARNQQWSCDVTASGFGDPATIDPRSATAVEHALRWLLRRFVDPPWLDERLQTRDRTAEDLTIDL